MLVELSRREKEANIKPDRDIDIYMKVRERGEFKIRKFWGKLGERTIAREIFSSTRENQI